MNMIIKALLMCFNYIKVCALKVRGKKILCPAKLMQSIHTHLLCIGRDATMIIGKEFSSRGNVTLIAQNGKLIIGDYVFFNTNCVVTALESIEIGDHCTFGPNVMIFDHDHDYRKDFSSKGQGFVTESIIIGDNVWIGANSVILRGTSIGDDCVVAAGTIVKGQIPACSLIYSERKMLFRTIEKKDGF